jgi:CHAD domain-containing protein
VAEPPWSDCVSRLRAAAGENLVLAGERPIAVVTSKLLVRRRRRLRVLLRKSQQTPRAPHRLRLKVKNLRYLAEESGSLGLAADPQELLLLKGLQG